jgi:hypothetical protein
LLLPIKIIWFTVFCCVIVLDAVKTIVAKGGVGEEVLGGLEGVET